MSTVITSDYISKAVDQVKKIKPDYRLMLDLYERIFIAQENSRKTIRMQEYTISDEVLSVKLKEKFPLVEVSEFIIDIESAGELFSAICEILLTAEGDMSESVKKIIDAVDNGTLATENLIPAFLREDEAFFNSIEKDHNIDRRVLGFVIFSCMKPSLAMFSEMMEKYLDKDNEWDKGYCPVCGSMPELSIFEDNGKRSLLCGFCGHQWPSKRVYCSFCENTDHETLRYFEIDNEEEYRVDVCEKCKRYIKTVDKKKTSRTMYLPLESIATPYIDLKFKEMGYIPGNIPVDQ
ncbi:MAG: formate dehydrogenase accessory protein FdhE [Spirochaetes bacterium]|nr:formate dehydrogenase accessory protein FdhE [Spirochaetota bacterium]